MPALSVIKHFSYIRHSSLKNSRCTLSQFITTDLSDWSQNSGGNLVLCSYPPRAGVPRWWDIQGREGESWSHSVMMLRRIIKYSLKWGLDLTHPHRWWMPSLPVYRVIFPLSVQMHTQFLRQREESSKQADQMKHALAYIMVVGVLHWQEEGSAPSLSEDRRAVSSRS